MKTRFAPTPSGYLHKGNIFSLLLTWLIARKNNGLIFLRIDDLDRDRVRSRYIDDIFQTIDWLGIDYDEGPTGPTAFENEFSQLKRLELYHEALKELQHIRDLTFSCNCSRSQIIDISPNGKYPGTCLNLKSIVKQPAALRINTPENQTVEWFDQIIGSKKVKPSDNMPYFVIKKKNGFPAYQLTSLIDDLHFDIDTLVRGNDLIDSTASQLFLSKQLKDTSFIKSSFYHHPLIKKTGRKLSKSQNDHAPEKSINSKKRLLAEFCKWVGVKEQYDDVNLILELYQTDHLKELGRTSD